MIETPGSRNLVEQLITMDLAGRPVVQQISIGGISGWYVDCSWTSILDCVSCDSLDSDGQIVSCKEY